MKSIKLAGLWEATNKQGKKFHASERITFGDLRSILKKFKEEHNVENDDEIVFFLFPYEGSNKRAPEYHLNFKKDDYKKGR